MLAKVAAVDWEVVSRPAASNVAFPCGLHLFEKKCKTRKRHCAWACGHIPTRAFPVGRRND